MCFRLSALQRHALIAWRIPISTNDDDRTHTDNSLELIDQKKDDSLGDELDDVDIDLLTTLSTCVSRNMTPDRRAAFDKVLKGGKPMSG